jgi:TRAP-type C4-dicarboxylate transport system permease small subunit
MLKILDKILKVILVIALAFAAIMIAWAGVLYIMKGGEKEEEIKKIKGRLIYAAVGLVVAFLAWVMTAILSRIISEGGAAI